jgi:acid phosphatase (class A)
VKASVKYFPIFAILAFLIASCTPTTSLSKEIKEIQAGILEGYVPYQERPNSLIILPPPPAEGSTAKKLDEEMAEKFIASTDTARKAMAARDAVLYFPEAAGAFNSVLDIRISEEQTPHLYMILRRSLTDAALSTYMAKSHYKRQRPFMAYGVSTCTPEDEEALKKDGSYPSGHTAIGWTWALILAEVFPEKADMIMVRGKEFGDSRSVCNVHWYSDVVAGRTMGTATYVKLHSNEDFLIDLEAAKKELAALRNVSQ